MPLNKAQMNNKEKSPARGQPGILKRGKTKEVMPFPSDLNFTLYRRGNKNQ